MRFLRPAAQWISRSVARSPRVVILVQQWWLSFGSEVLDIRMASWVIRRPEWLRGRRYIDSLKLQPASDPADDAYIDIAHRLVRSWSSVSQSSTASVGKSPGSIWDGLIDTHYRHLVTLLGDADVAGLSKYLGQLFRSKAVDGFTYGSTFDNWPHRWAYLPIQIELSAVQLAEALGVIRAECHEQGEVAFWRRLVTEGELIDRLESALGIRIEQPRHGDPRGIVFGERFLTRETCSHLHSAYRVKVAIEAAGLAGDINVVEIGGGFGGTCYWLKRLLGGRIKRYVIVDLPEVGIVQAFFHGAENPNGVRLPGEATPEGFSGVEIVRHTDLRSIDFRPSVILNQDSFPEMPVSEVERYISWAGETLDGIFVSLNQETYSSCGGVLQVSVPEVFKRHGSFRRVSRVTSWDRRGYVEEVYVACRGD